MRKLIATTFLTALLASPMALAQDRQLDPIFEVTQVSGQPDASCIENTRDDRNIFVRAATSTVGQTIIGGLLGAALGNQIGGGSGKDIATGVGAAVGASAGAYNAQRQREARIRECQQYQGYANNGNNSYGQNSYGNGYSNSPTYQSGYGDYNTSAAAGFSPSR